VLAPGGVARARLEWKADRTVWSGETRCCGIDGPDDLGPLPPGTYSLSVELQIGTARPIAARASVRVSPSAPPPPPPPGTPVVTILSNPSSLPGAQSVAEGFARTGALACHTRPVGGIGGIGPPPVDVVTLTLQVEPDGSTSQVHASDVTPLGRCLEARARALSWPAPARGAPAEVSFKLTFPGP
jgi:hypothetical protein